MAVNRAGTASESRPSGPEHLDYVCPDCKHPLKDLYCSNCNTQFHRKDGFAYLLSKDPRFGAGRDIGRTYDDIYTHRSGVWEDQGRTPEFISFFASLLERFSPERILELGCGEGFLLSAVNAREKFATDLSTHALQKASEKTTASFAIALAERIPFPDASFDLVTSVGVMEHFLDDHAAGSEVFRILVPGGFYVALIHVNLTFLQTFNQKIREYFFPAFRPVALAKWLSSKVIRPVSQPIQRAYTLDSAKLCLARCGFQIDEVITSQSHPGIPLIGPHVVIYVARKPS